MKLNLQKPLVIFDLETTGLDLVKDRVIQISYIKVYPDGREERGDHLINPEKPIEPIITQLTGISDDDVKDKPTFKQLAKELAEKFAGSDFAGFNSNNFDIPLLAEEFLRAGVDFDFSKCRMIDACTIFRKMERRNLAAAYKFYCGRKMEEDFEAHRADQDTEATYRVLMGQLDKYAPGANEDPEKVLENDMDMLNEFSKQNKNVDFAGRIVWAEQKDESPTRRRRQAQDDRGVQLRQAQGAPRGRRAAYRSGLLQLDPGWRLHVQHEAGADAHPSP